jgi:hypothetical protein
MPFCGGEDGDVLSISIGLSPPMAFFFLILGGVTSRTALSFLTSTASSRGVIIVGNSSLAAVRSSFEPEIPLCLGVAIALLPFAILGRSPALPEALRLPLMPLSPLLLEMYGIGDGDFMRIL